MKQDKFEVGDVVIIARPSENFSNMKGKIGIISAIHDIAYYVELFEPVIDDYGDKMYFTELPSCKYIFDKGAMTNGKLYFTAEYEDELDHLTLSEMDAKMMGYTYKIQGKIFIIPSDYFD